MARHVSRPQPARPADPVLALLNKLRLYEERENVLTTALEAADRKLEKLENERAGMLERNTELRERNRELRAGMLELDAQCRELRSRIHPESDSESDSDYEPEPEEEPEPVRRSLADVYTQLEESGCRAHTLAHILRTTMRFPNADINPAYNRVLNTSRFYGTLQKDDIQPNFWKVLGRNEDEKLYNAKKVMEILYRT
jgi:chromosome segregation ATPase